MLTIKSTLTVLGAALLCALAAHSSRAAAPTRPNVLLLISDDLNTLLGSYGDPRAKTPHIDRLAARGVRFDRAYCAYPLCGPSRNSMLTGLYPNSNGVLGNGQIFRQTVPNQVSLPEAFRHAGYLAVRIGKAYHYGVPNSIGTTGDDDPASWEIQFNPAGVDRTEEHPKIVSLKQGEFGGTVSWYASPKGDAEHTDGILAENAEWVIERAARRRDRPFFLTVGFFRPHTPYVAPRDPYFGYYPENEMPVIGGVKEDQRDIPPAALMSYKQEQDKFTDRLRRQALQAYYASISFMDAQVGRVVNALERLGLADNTIVVFTSDHGYHVGEHGLWQKMSLFEESARVPLLIVAPGTAVPGGVARAPVSLVDVYPTLAELAGVSAPDNLQGQSLVPMLRDPEQPGRGWALTQIWRGGATRRLGVNTNTPQRFFGYSLRTPRWRYTEWGEGAQGRELYDHERDPRELTNLADSPAHAAMVKELSAQLAAAVKSSFPSSGRRPEVQDGSWKPIIFKP